MIMMMTDTMFARSAPAASETMLLSELAFSWGAFLSRKEPDERRGKQLKQGDET